MARPKHADTRYLELKNGKYRVTVPVPRALHAKFGTKLKKPLNTDSRAVANTLKWEVVAELRAIIDRAASETAGDQLAREALELSAYRATVRHHRELALLDDAVAERGEEIAGEPIAAEKDPDTGAVPRTSTTRTGRAGRAYSLRWSVVGQRPSTTTTRASSPGPSSGDMSAIVSGASSTVAPSAADAVRVSISWSEIFGTLGVQRLRRDKPAAPAASLT